MAVKAAKRTIRGIELMTVLRGHEDVILRLNWSPDGKTLASSSVDRSIRLWDLAGGICRAVLSGHSHGVNEVAWAPDVLVTDLSDQLAFLEPGGGGL